MLKYKHAHTTTELQEQHRDYTDMLKENHICTLREWNTEKVEQTRNTLGLGGSPTKVKEIESVVLFKKSRNALPKKIKI